MYPLADVVEYHVPRMLSAVAAVLMTFAIVIVWSPFRHLGEYRSEAGPIPGRMLAAVAFSTDDKTKMLGEGGFESDRLGVAVAVPESIVDQDGIVRRLASFERSWGADFIIAPVARRSGSGREVSNDYTYLSENDLRGNPAGNAYWKIETAKIAPDELDEFAERRFGEGCAAGLAVSHGDVLEIPIFRDGAGVCAAAGEYSVLYSPVTKTVVVWKADQGRFALPDGSFFDTSEAVRFLDRS